MRILITGADGPLGGAAAHALRDGHELRLTGETALSPAGLQALEYVPADLREPGQVEPLLEGVDAVAHLAPYAAPEPLADEAEILDRAARGTFVLLHAARRAGAGRVVLASRLELLAPYGEGCLVDETWKPLPSPDASSLAPFVAELTMREFVRVEEIAGICLRFGEPGPGGTTLGDAGRALRRALEMELPRGYRWHLYHISSTDRYPLGPAARPPMSFHRGEEDAPGS